MVSRRKKDVKTRLVIEGNSVYEIEEECMEEGERREPVPRKERWKPEETMEHRGPARNAPA